MHSKRTRRAAPPHRIQSEHYMSIELKETSLIDEWLTDFAVAPCSQAGERSVVVTCRDTPFHCVFRYNAKTGFSEDFPLFLDMLTEKVISSLRLLDSQLLLTRGFVRPAIDCAMESIVSGALKFKKEVRYALFRMEMTPSAGQSFYISALKDVLDVEEIPVVKLDNTRKRLTVTELRFEKDVMADGETRYAFRPCYILRPPEGGLQLLFDANAGIALTPHLPAEAHSDEPRIDYYSRADAESPCRHYHVSEADSLADLIAAAWAETGQPAGFIPFARRARLSLLSCICRVLAQMRLQPDSETPLLATLYVNTSGEFSIRGSRYLFDFPFWDGGKLDFSFPSADHTLPTCRYQPHNFGTFF